MTTETRDFNKPELKVPETDDESNYCSHNNFGRVRMTINPGQSSKHETNLHNNDHTSMEIILEEVKEAAREHRAQDPANKLVFRWADADKNDTQASLGKFNLKKHSIYCSRRDCAGTLVSVGTTRIGKWSSLPKMAY